MVEEDLALGCLREGIVPLDFLITSFPFLGFKLLFSSFAIESHDRLLSLVGFWTHWTTLYQLKIGVELLALHDLKSLFGIFDHSHPIVFISATGLLVKRVFLVIVQNFEILVDFFGHLAILFDRTPLKWIISKLLWID